MNKNVISKETAEKICKEVFSVADFCRKVGWKPKGSNYKTFYKYVKEYNLDTSHFTGFRTNIGNRLNEKNNMSNEDYFVKGKTKKSSEIVKRILKYNLKKYECSCCKISDWNGKPLTLQLHHIDGDSTNNTLDNLVFLCPNCHSQTDNFAGKANKKGICNRTHVMTRKYICKNCGKPLHKEPKTGLCKDCLIKQQKANKSACSEKNKVEAG